jgi:hypothetical protein
VDDYFVDVNRQVGHEALQDFIVVFDVINLCQFLEEGIVLIELDDGLSLYYKDLSHLLQRRLINFSLPKI